MAHSQLFHIHNVVCSRYLANKCAMAARIDSFADYTTKRYGEKLREQVEERLAFYESGEAPRKNLDVMEAVAAELRAEGVSVGAGGGAGGGAGAATSASSADAAATPGKKAKKSKKEKKSKKRSRSDADEDVDMVRQGRLQHTAQLGVCVSKQTDVGDT